MKTGIVLSIIIADFLVYCSNLKKLHGVLCGFFITIVVYTSAVFVLRSIETDDIIMDYLSKQEIIKKWIRQKASNDNRPATATVAGAQANQRLTTEIAASEYQLR